MIDSLRYSGIASAILVATVLGAASCGTDTGEEAAEAVTSVAVQNPILFVTQVPVSGFTTVTSPFGNHLPTTSLAPPGGDLYILYPDGTLRNLTREAGFGNTGLQGAKSIAVREPSVHWSGTKALFSMTIGSPPARFADVTSHWQIYEITGLGEGEVAKVTLVPRQPSGYNNVAPAYGTDDRVIFTSDRPRNGQASLYPQLDEYESVDTVTGLWSLDTASGDLRLLNHAPSGAFSPTIDSAGRLVFTRWDHLLRDQQADEDKFEGASNGSFNYADESGAQNSVGNNKEVFPEPRLQEDPDLLPNQAPHVFNQFFPWTINEDGTAEETLDHVGRQELGGSYTSGSFTDDPNLTYDTPESDHQNRTYVASEGGFFQLKEDPTTPGTFYGTNAAEFGSEHRGRDHQAHGRRGAERRADGGDQRDQSGGAGGDRRRPGPGGRTPGPLPQPVAARQRRAHRRAHRGDPERRERWIHHPPALSLRLPAEDDGEVGRLLDRWSAAHSGHHQEPHLLRSRRARDRDRQSVGARSGRGAGAPAAHQAGGGAALAGELGAPPEGRRRGRPARLAAPEGPGHHRLAQRDHARSRRRAAAVQPAGAGRRVDHRRARQDLRRIVSPALPGRSHPRLRAPPAPRAPPSRCTIPRRRTRLRAAPRARWRSARTGRWRRSCPPSAR